MKKLLTLLAILSFFACDSSNHQATIASLNEELAAAKKTLATASASSSTGLVHSVFFWLKEDLTAAEEKAFKDGLKSLATIKTVQQCLIGPPAPTEKRDVIDDSYSYALLLHFADIDDQDAYQVDPLHLKFIEDHKDKWTKVIVYDNSVEE